MMDKVIRCCFAGHHDVYGENIFDRIKEVAENLIVNYGVNEFWVGNYGGFDGWSASAIRELKMKYSHIELDLVIPYLTEKINENKEQYYKNYDNIIVAEIQANTPKRFHIIKANEFMVDNADFLICYVERSWGGALRTYEYAKRKNKKIYNLKSLENLGCCVQLT